MSSREPARTAMSYKVLSKSVLIANCKLHYKNQIELLFFDYFSNALVM